MLPQKMGANFMVKHAKHSTTSVLTWKFNVHFAFACLYIVRNAGWSNLVPLEIDSDPFFDSKLTQVFRDGIAYFLLIKYFAFGIEISTLRSIFRQEAVQHLNSNIEISAIRFFKLFNELPRTFCIVIFKYRIDLVITLEELLLALLKVLGQCAVD